MAKSKTPRKTARLQRKQALLIVDCVNDLEFPGSDKLLPWAERLVTPLLTVRKKAHAKNIPVIYANDNYGLWRGSFEDVFKHCTRPGAKGQKLTRKLKPTKSDFYILKPRHSAFFSTSLVPLLEYLKVKELILCGIATNLCVLFTAHDAHMLGYKLTVLSDCCAAETDFDHDSSLRQLERYCGARICLSSELRL